MSNKNPEWRSRVTLMAPTVEKIPKKRGRPPMTEEDRAAGQLLSKSRRAVWQREMRAKIKAGLDLPTNSKKSPGPRRIPLEGRVFGDLTVMHYEDTIGPRGGRKSRWRLRCSCGVELVLRTDQLLAVYGRKHCGHARGQTYAPTEMMPTDRKKRGNQNPVGRVRKERAKTQRPARVWTAAEIEERELDAAERLERKMRNVENAERSRKGERMLPAPKKEMDAAGWIRLLRTMRRAGARWAELTMELESAAAFGVTRELVEVAA